MTTPPQVACAALAVRRASFIAALAAVLFVAGCATLPSADAQLAATCQTYANTLQTLAVYKPSLSEKQIATVNHVRSIANPICLQHDYADAGSALDTLTAALMRIERVKQGAK